MNSEGKPNDSDDIFSKRPNVRHASSGSQKKPNPLTKHQRTPRKTNGTLVMRLNEKHTFIESQKKNQKTGFKEEKFTRDKTAQRTFIKKQMSQNQEEQINPTKVGMRKTITNKTIETSSNKIPGITAFHEKKSLKMSDSNLEATRSSSHVSLDKKMPLPNRLRYHPAHKKLRFVLFPDDPFIVFWGWVRTLAIFYSCSLAPFRLSFISQEEMGSERGWTLVDLWMDLVFGIDLVLNFFTAFYDVDNVLIIKKRLIFINYIFGWFLMDLLSSIPFDLVSDAGIGVLFKLTKIPRLLKVFRILKVMKLTEMLKKFSFLGGFFSHPHAGRLIVSMFMYMVVFHVVACLWHFVASFDGYQDPENWVMRLGYMNHSIIEVLVAQWLL